MIDGGRIVGASVERATWVHSATLMSMETVALLRLPRAAFESFARAPSPSDDASVVRLTGADKKPFDVRFLDDATIVFTGVPFDGDAEDVLDVLDDRLDQLFDEHDEARGLFVFPRKALVAVSTYQAMLDEVGELGEWIALDADDSNEADAAAQRGVIVNDADDEDDEDDGGDLMQMVAGLANSLGPETLARMQSAMFSGDPNAMARAQQEMMTALMSRGDLDQITAQFQGLASKLPPELLNMPMNASPEDIMNSLPPEQREALERQLGGAPKPPRR